MKKFFLFFFLLLLITISGVYVFFSVKPRELSQKEKIAAMKQLLGHDPIISGSSHKDDWITHTGKYLKFSYPASATVYPSSVNANPSKNSLEIFMFQGKNPKYFFGTEVLSAGDIQTYDDISGVLMRRREKETYTETQLSYDNIRFPVFTKLQSNDIEKTAFLLFKGKEYTFSITSSDPDTIQIFDRIVKSIKLMDN